MIFFSLMLGNFVTYSCTLSKLDKNGIIMLISTMYSEIKKGEIRNKLKEKYIELLISTNVYI